MFRIIRGCRSVFIGMTILAVLMAIPLNHALATLVSTQALKAELDPEHFRTQMKNFLAREDVRIAFLKHGLVPAEVEARIVALTDDEVSPICDSLDELPAGGMAAIAYPIGLVILMVLGYVLVVTGVISLGAYAAVKVQESQEEKYAKSTPFPAPPRFGALPNVNPDEPWTGRWKVTEDRFRGVYCLKQIGDKVVSTSDSDQIVDAKIYGAMIIGNIGARQSFRATIASDFLSFKGNVDSRYSFDGQKIESAELKPEPTLNTLEPWTGKWKVSSGRLPGIWSLSQKGDSVVSISDSDYKLEAKVNGDIIIGKWSSKGGIDRDFRATISADGLSFNAVADLHSIPAYFSAKKIE